ncbi:MAG: hypothetical protein AVDCRST_MAG15-1263, partial [uncultured Rubellimicrobium sp.]
LCRTRAALLHGQHPQSSRGRRGL